MYKYIIKYYKYLISIFFIYILINIFRNLVNIYSVLILIIILIVLYNTKRKILKKILYKLIYKNRNNTSFRNKFGAVKYSLEEINEINNKINSKVKSELLNHERSKLEAQLNSGDYKVTLFGAGSSGKTSLARALLKSLIGKTSPTIGTTMEITSYKINIPILKRNIDIIDTPGLFEPSSKGQEREETTLIQASRSDIILFVMDQDINKYELYLIKKLSEIGKKLIIVLNKCDLRSEKQNNIIKENIIYILSKELDKQSTIPKVVKTIASSKFLPNNSQKEFNRIPDVNSLFKEIIETLDDNGEELLADNILFSCNKLGLISNKLISEQRDIAAKKVINKYSWITGGVILVNPLPVIDFLTTTSVNIQMIFEISKIYEIQLTKNQASDLSKSLIDTLAKLGILKGGLALMTTALSLNFTTILISKSIQSITTGWLMRIVGLSLIEYFKNGKNWGEEGIQGVVNNIYQLSKRQEILNNFIHEAISKLKIKNDFRFLKKLPQQNLED